MNKDTVKGSWNQVKGRLKAQWGDLTDDDLTRAEGNMDYLVGRVQSLYGSTREDIQVKLRELGLMD